MHFTNRFKRNPVLVNSIDEIWQADLEDVSNLSKENKDVFSKFSFVVALKNKSATAVKKAFEDISEIRKRKSQEK